MKNKYGIARIPVSIIILAAAMMVSLPAHAASNRICRCISPSKGTVNHTFGASAVNCPVQEEETVTIYAEWKPDGMASASCNGYAGLRSMQLVLTETTTGTTASYPTSGILCSAESVPRNWAGSGNPSTSWVSSQASTPKPDLSAAVVTLMIYVRTTGTTPPYAVGTKSDAAICGFGGTSPMEGIGDYSFNFVVNSRPDKLTFMCASPSRGGGLVGGTFWHDFAAVSKTCTAAGADTVTIGGQYAPTSSKDANSCADAGSGYRRGLSYKLWSTLTTSSYAGCYSGGSGQGASEFVCSRCKTISAGCSPASACDTGCEPVTGQCNWYGCDNPTTCNTSGGGIAGCGNGTTQARDVSCNKQFNKAAPSTEGVYSAWANMEYGHKLLEDIAPASTSSVYYFNLYVWTGFPNYISGSWTSCPYLTNSNQYCWGKYGNTPTFQIRCQDVNDGYGSGTSSPNIQRVRFYDSTTGYDRRAYRNVDTSTHYTDSSYNDNTHINITGSSQSGSGNDYSTIFNETITSTADYDYDVYSQCEDDYGFQDGYKNTADTGYAYKLRVDNTSPDGTSYPVYSVSGCNYSSGNICWIKAGTSLYVSQQWYDSKSTPKTHYFVMDASGGTYPFTVNYYTAGSVNVGYNATTSFAAHTPGSSDDSTIVIDEVRCMEASGCTGNTVTMRWNLHAVGGNKTYTVGGYMYDEVQNGQGYCFTFPCTSGVAKYIYTDTEIPTITLSSHTSGGTYNISNVITVTGTASDGSQASRSGVASVQYAECNSAGSTCGSWTSIGAADPTNWTFIVSNSILTNNSGVRRIKLRSVDNTGNASAEVYLLFRFVPYDRAITSCVDGSGSTSAVVADGSDTISCTIRVFIYDVTATYYTRLLLNYLDNGTNSGDERGYFYNSNGTWGKNTGYGDSYVNLQSGACSRTPDSTNGFVDYKFVWNLYSTYGDMQNNDPNSHLRVWADSSTADGSGNYNGFHITGINWYEMGDAFDVLPAAPSALTGTADSTSQITWSWTDNSGTVETGFKLHDGSDGAIYTGASASYANTGLSPNTQYTRHVHAYDSATASRAGTSGSYTFDNPGVAGLGPRSSSTSKYSKANNPSVTCSRTPACTSWSSVATFTFTAGGSPAFGTGNLQYYRYVWDQNSTYASWTNTETQWSSGTLAKTATADGAWYLHVRSYNGDNEVGGTTDYGPYYYQGSAPTAGTVTPASTSYGSYVDATFNVTTTFTDSYSGVASCQYCKSTDGTCDTEWAAGTWGSGTCSITGLTCTDGQSLTLNMRATNNAGNTGTATAVTRTCDTVAPTTTDNATTTWRNTDLTVTLSPTDARSGVGATYYCVDTAGTCTPSTSGTSVTVSCTSGSVCAAQYVRYYSVDNVGNTESTKTSVVIRIDKQLPTVTINSPATSTWENAGFTVDVTNSDASGSGLSVCYYRVLSNSVQTLGWTSYTCTSDPVLSVGSSSNCRDQGSNMCQVEFYDTDVAGNTGSTVTRQFSIDWTAPSAGTVTPSSTATASYVDATFNLSTTFTDAHSGVASCQYCKSTDGTCDTEWTAGTWSSGTCSVTGLTCTDGQSLTLNMRAPDNASNTGTATAVTRTCDTVAPTTTDNATTAWRNTDLTVTLSPTDARSGVGATYYCVDTAGTCTPSTSGTSVTVSCTSGSVCAAQYVRYYSVDNVGNTESTKTSVVIRIDKQLPTVTINSPAASTWENAGFTVDVTNSDASGSGLSVCYYRVVSNSVQTLGWTSYTCTSDPSTITVGSSSNCRDQGSNMCQVEFYDTDVAGNTGSTVTRQFSIDWTAPSAGTVTPASTATASYVDATFNLSTTFTDSHSGVASCQYCKSTDGTCDTEWTAGTWSSGTCSVTGLTCTDGQSLTLNMRAPDNASNTGTATAVTRTCDAVAPTTTDNANTTWRNTDMTVTLSPTDARSGVGATYYCVDTAGTCTPSTSGTSVTVSCTSGSVCAAQYVRYYSVDNVGNTETTKTSVGIRIDKQLPTVTINSPAASTWERTGFTVDVTNSDASGSGLNLCYYRVLSNSVQIVGWTSYTCTTDPSITVGSSSNCRDQGSNMCQVEFYDTDVAGNTGSTVTRQFSIDWTAPNNPSAVSGYDSSSKSVTLTSGLTYSYTGATGPYFEWTAPSDLPSSSNSGIAGYYVYFGTSSTADPSSYQTGATYTNTATLTAGTIYYLRIKTRDNAGNTSSAATMFTYRYSGGGYLRVTEIDADATSYGTDLGSSDNLDGVLAPNNTAFEIVSIYLYDEWDTLASNGALATKQVTVSLSNVGSTGVYIASTNLTGATTGGTSVTGNLVGGWAWIKIKANGSEQSSAVVVSATGTGLSGTGGRNQKAYILVRTDTGSSMVVNQIDYGVGSPTSGDTVMHPVWSPSGTSVVFAMRGSSSSKWNLYRMDWGGSSWGTPARLTNDAMNVQPSGKYSFSPDGLFVTFVSYDGEPELYSVLSSGLDKDLTLSALAIANEKISNGTSARQWWDAEWSRSSCTNGYGSRLLVSSATGTGGEGLELYMFSGATNGLGLFTELASTFTTVTAVGGYGMWSFQPSWSKDCSKIAFVVWDGWSTQARTGIYIINLSDASLGSTVTLPVTSLTQTGVYKIHDCTDTSCTVGSALFPTFTNDGTMVSYMVDPDNTFQMSTLILAGFNGTDLTSNFFNGENFDNYLEYIYDQPTFAPQLIGQSANNEFGLTQCFGSSCPNSTYGNLFTYITQKTGSTDGKLSFLELSDVNTVTNNGGLLFYQGSVTAVVPPGALDSDAVLTVDTAAPSGTPASTDDLLLSTGEAREFFPDGVVFSKDIRMIFHYCDADNSGYLDVNQDAGCTGGGDTTMDENKLYVYYYCSNGATLGCTSNSWVQLDGSVDPVNNTITVAINHFSKYDVYALMRGLLAPGDFVELNLDDLHTFPNPWRSVNGNITFYAGPASTYNTGGVITVDVQIYDLRGKIVKEIRKVHSGTIAASGAGLELATWDAKNNGGRQLASGVYMYVLRINDGVFSRTHNGKLAIVR